jgi:hypothetical protein
MEIGKLLTVSYLYRRWKKLNLLHRIFYVLIVLVLVFLTSLEVIGFLSQSHSKTSLNLRMAETKIRSLNNEEAIIKGQMSVVDTTLAGLPRSYVTRRIKERKKAGYSEKEARLLDISKEKALLETQILQDKERAGPIFAVARIMKVNETNAIAIFILLLVLVLEPLSIGLTVATSSAWLMQKEIPKTKPKEDRTLSELNSLRKKHNLTALKLQSITGRKKLKTCEGWLKGASPIPPRALQAVYAWAEQQNT